MVSGWLKLLVYGIQVLAELQVHKKHLMYLLLVDYQYYTL